MAEAKLVVKLQLRDLSDELLATVAASAATVRPRDRMV
jgi:hypothetical protein